MSKSARILLVSAVASGQGKTTVTAALARKFSRQGLRVRIFKAGPDFLDPMILERASGAPVYTLDLWMVGPAQCRALLANAAVDADVILIEGVMGLYDGDPSTADLAHAFGVPVLAVLDASKMAQTAGAVMMGLRDYGPVALAGVIANRIGSERHADMVAAAMRDIPLLGSLSRQEQSLPERHLGLVQPEEIDALDVLLDRVAAQLSFDANAWERLPASVFGDDEYTVGEHTSDEPAASATTAGSLVGKTIAVARDRAFAFIYPANLDWLQAAGAHIVFFSPLADDPVPAEADAVWLPGGYPELHAGALSAATRWQDSLRSAHAGGLPILAECGGLMAIADSLTDLAGRTWKMAGLLPGSVQMQTQLAAIGLQGWTTENGQLRGHAFHYSRLETAVEPAAHTIKHPVGERGEAIYRSEAMTASYFHAYFPSCPAAAAHLFVSGDAA